MFSIGNGVNFGMLDSCSFSNCGTVFTVTSTNNNGERISIRNCQFLSCTLVAQDVTVSGDANFGMYFFGCSFDGGGPIFLSQGMRGWFFGCHTEQFADTGYMLSVTGASAGIWWIGGEIILGGVGGANLAIYTFAYSDASSASGINISDVYLSKSTQYKFQLLCSGLGPFQAEINTQGTTQQFQAFAEANNVIPDGHFYLGNIQSWTTTGATVAYDGTTGHTTNGCIKLTGSAAQVVAYVTAKAVPGQRVGLSPWFKTTGFAGHSGQGTFIVLAFDQLGNLIGSVCSVTTGAVGTDTAAWALNPVSSQGVCPPGTYTLRLELVLASDASGNAIMWCDDIFGLIE
jgi:hypothetical protein